MKSYIIVFLLLWTVGYAFTSNATPADSTVVQQVYAWKAESLLGTRITSNVDTLHTNFAQEMVPNMISDAYATTGNYASEGYNMIYFDRPQVGPFFFRDALSYWLPSTGSMTYYNTHIPMTLLSYTTGGSKETIQDRLKCRFSGNVNRRAQIGALLDYYYSKGSYNYQAAKNYIWGFSGSYIGDRYEFQGFYNHYNGINKENGGITDDRYITDPAEVQGGSTSVDTKSIPTNLTAAHNRLKGAELWLNNRYKIGFWKEIYDDEFEDSIISREYIPVTAITWTLQYNQGNHMFKNTSARDDADFWNNTYLNPAGTNDITTYHQLRNTVAFSLMEGFNKYAQAGIDAFITHEHRKYNQTIDTIPLLPEIEGITPYPYDTKLAPKASLNYVWAGGRLSRRQGEVLNYQATAQIGLVGRAAGEVLVDGDVEARIRMLGDTVRIQADGAFYNQTPEYLLENYVSNHFIWRNEFAKSRRYRVGGQLHIPQTGTRLLAGIENVQNQIYFGPDCVPLQFDGNVQVFSAALHQNIKYRAFHWDNRVTYQTTSDDRVIPLPSLAVYSNMYLAFNIATLHVQMGIDCDYYTRYRAVAYQPATATFYNQRDIKCGNYPWMNFYVNMKLSKTRFYVMMSHVNQGLTGNNYFSMPHYPLNPRRFQMGLSVDFAN